MHHSLAVLTLVHVNEVDDNDAAEVAQPDLAHNFSDCIDVRLNDGVFQARRLSDKLAGVDVDRHQGFRLVDDDVPTALQPYFGFERLVDLVGNAELLEERSVLGIEFHALQHRGLEAAHEAHDPFVFLLGVYPNGAEAGGDLIAQNAFHQIQIVVEQRRRF